MKPLRMINKILLCVAIFSGILLLVINRLPDLPSSKPIIPGNSGLEVREYITENIFAIICFIVSLTLSLLVEMYGLSLRRNISNLKIDSNAWVILGLFIFVSGIWILTDSKILTVFTTDYGGMLDKNAITFVSYISFMLIPIIFLAFLQHIMQINWLWKIGGLFILNLCVFVILNFFHLSQALYFILLMVHHLLIYFIATFGIVYSIRSFHNNTKDKRKSLLFRGLIFFMGFSSIALVVFFLNHPRAYAIIYNMGFFIMIWYMIRLTVQQILSGYNQSVKTEMYQSMAYTDLLTNLKNKNAFISEQYDRAVQADTCCIVIDINKLKLVNDTFGHSSGDELICRSANIVYEVFSDIGDCYRIGGDEFAVVCRNTDEAFVKKMIKKMEERIAAVNSGIELKIDLAYGYAFISSDTDKFVDLFNAADNNMYLDKNLSRQ